MTSPVETGALVDLTRDVFDMVKSYRDEAVVLRTYKFGEADRVVVLLTRDHGKVRAVAKGVRKGKSRFGGRLEPLSTVDIQLHLGRSLDTIQQVELVHTHTKLRTDFARLGQGLSMAEAIDTLTPDREPVEHLYELLSRALAELNRQQSPLLLGAFYWKVLAADGAGPVLDSCARCDERAELVSFDFVEGGALCGQCRTGTPVSFAALELIRRILGGALAQALESEDSPVVNEVNALARRAMEFHLERRLKSIGVFDRHL
ncbi:MAG: repair protein RecO [Actinomycetota bacterium]|jgi:DNA repair protein RecO (recombination protein O)